MNLINNLEKGNIFVADSYPDTDSFYADFSLFLKEKGIIVSSETVKRLFVKREGIQSTAIGKGAAAPHIFSSEFKRFLFTIAWIKKGMDFKSPDGGLIYLVFLLMSDERDVGLHLKSLAHIARLVSCTDLGKEIKKASTVDQIYDVLLSCEKQI